MRDQNVALDPGSGNKNLPHLTRRYYEASSAAFNNCSSWLISRDFKIISLLSRPEILAFSRAYNILTDHYSGTIEAFHSGDLSQQCFAKA